MKKAFINFVVVCLCALIPSLALAQTPAMTTITDRLLSLTGVPVTGTLSISNNSTMVSYDGFNVPFNTKTTVTLAADGSFTVQLVPNIGAAPAGSSYSAVYRTSVATVREVWVVPQSGTAVNLVAVRVPQLSGPSVMLPIAQVIAPPNCIALGGVPQFTVTGWTCAAGGTGGLSDPGASGIVKRTALNTTGIAVLADFTGLGLVPITITVNGHPLSGNVVVSASDLTTGTLPHAQLPTLLSADIPNNTANTTGTAGGLSANILESQVTNLTTDLAAKVPTTTTVNGHPLSSNVTVSASDLTTGTLPHAQLPALISGDIPNNAANTSGNASTATALAAVPTQCGGGTPIATGVAANGNANCTAAGAGFANPMTGPGDLIGGGAAGAPTRIAAGKTGQTCVATNGSPCAFASPGIADGNGAAHVTTTPYTVACDSVSATLDRVTTIVFDSGSSVITAPDHTATGCGGNMPVTLVNESGGTLTVNRGGTDTFNVTGNVAKSIAAISFTIPDSGSAALNNGEAGIWNARILQPSAGGGTVTTTGSPASPNLSCFSAPTVITNCANVSAHQFRGNNTGSSGAETPSFIGASDVSPNMYAAGAGVAQAQTVTLTPAATALTSGLSVCWKPTAANTGAAPTLAVNGLTATAITKLGTTALVANDLTTTAVACAIYDGTQFELQNPQTASSGTPTYPVTVAGTVTSGGIPCFTSTTQQSSSGLMTTNVYMKGGGAGVCPSPGLTTDDGTSSTYTGAGGTKSPAFTATDSSHAGSIDLPQGPDPTSTAPCNAANSVCRYAGTSQTAMFVKVPPAPPTIASYEQTDSCASAKCVDSFHPVPIVLSVTADFTDTSSTALQAITGLGFTFPANQALNAKVDCDILYNQTVAAVADAWGVQDVTVAPTNVEATGFTQTAATTWAEQQLLTLTTTTATNIGTFTPSAITTVWHAQLHALIEHPSNASTSAFNIMVSQSTAADLMVVKRGSACTVTFQ